MYKSTQVDITNLERAIKIGKENLGEKPTEEEFKELEEHNKKQTRLKEIGKYKGATDKLEKDEKALKDLKKAQNDLKAAIGTRLKI